MNDSDKELNPPIDLTGKKINNLTIIKLFDKVTKGKTHYYRWLCRCECGAIKIASTANINAGKVKTCGCRNAKSTTPYNRLLKKYKDGASKRGLVFKLSLDDIMDLCFKNCFYCGTEPFQVLKVNNHEIKYIGIDRIENDTGYTRDNCVPCCVNCNKMKLDHSLSDFLHNVNVIATRFNKDITVSNNSQELALLNGAIMTNAGDYVTIKIELDDAKRLAKSMTTKSYIGHQSTAELMTELLEHDIEASRGELQQQVGQMALVFKLKQRAPEGVILPKEELEKIGYEFWLMYRTR